MTRAAINRSPWFKRPSFLATAIIVAGALVAFIVSDSARLFVFLAAETCIYGVPSNEDVKEAAAVENTITAIHHFARNSRLQPDSPPISSHPGSRMLLIKPTIVVVYEIKDPVEQDKVISAVRTLVHERKFNPVDLRFLDHENWIVNGNVGYRGPETELRRVRITQSGTREEGGTKIIRYPLP